MKKFLMSMLPILLVAFMSVNFASCSSDDKDEELVPPTEQTDSAGNGIGNNLDDEKNSGEENHEGAAGNGTTDNGGDNGDETLPDSGNSDGTTDDGATGNPGNNGGGAGDDVIGGEEIIPDGDETTEPETPVVPDGIPETAEAGEAVDLGLSVKWANCNVGAAHPWEYGGYYAWGETEEKSDYSWETYKYSDGTYNTITKYCVSSDYGAVDGKTVLEPEDDVAHVKWGGNWRMPTGEEQYELSTICTWNWTTQNNIKGWRVTGPNGRSIFLPAAGYRYAIAVLGINSWGYYYSGSLYDNGSYGAFFLCFNEKSYAAWRSYYRPYGYSVRPVCP